VSMLARSNDASLDQSLSSMMRDGWARADGGGHVEIKYCLSKLARRVSLLRSCRLVSRGGYQCGGSARRMYYMWIMVAGSEVEMMTSNMYVE
jgi:hypothetical protein